MTALLVFANLTNLLLKTIFVWLQIYIIDKIIFREHILCDMGTQNYETKLFLVDTEKSIWREEIT